MESREIKVTAVTTRRSTPCPRRNHARQHAARLLGDQATPSPSPISMPARRRPDGADRPRGPDRPGRAATVPPLTSHGPGRHQRLTLTGSIAEINAALDGLTYTPLNGFTGPYPDRDDRDLGNTGGAIPPTSTRSRLRSGRCPTATVDDPVAVAEANSGQANSITFAVSLSAPSTLQVQVPYTIASGTANGVRPAARASTRAPGRPASLRAERHQPVDPCRSAATPWPRATRRYSRPRHADQRDGAGRPGHRHDRRRRKRGRPLDLRRHGGRGRRRHQRP